MPADKRPKFLVSWVELNGNPRGQTCMDREEVNRLVDHIVSLKEYIIIDARHIGAAVRFHRNHEYVAPPMPAEPKEVN